MLQISEKIALSEFLTVLPEAVLLYQDRNIQKAVNGRESPYNQKQVEHMYHFQATHGRLWYIWYDKNFAGDFAISDQNEVAITVIEKYQQRGIGSRLLRYFTPRDQKLWAKILPDNLPSQGLFEKCGFSHQGEMSEGNKKYLKFAIINNEKC